MTELPSVEQPNETQGLYERRPSSEVYILCSSLDDKFLSAFCAHDSSTLVASGSELLAKTCLCTPKGLITPFQLSNHESLHYDATSHHLLEQSLIKAFDPLPPYETTTHAIEECSSASLSDGTNIFTNLDQILRIRNRDDATHPHDPQSTVNHLYASFEHSKSAIPKPAEIISSNDCKAKFPASPESFKGKSIPRHVSPTRTNKTLSINGDYWNTNHTCEYTPTPEGASAVNENAPLIGPTARLWPPHSTTSLGSLEARAGSDILSDIEYSPLPKVGITVGRPQLVAWVQQRCAKVMTLSEKMEMNKHVWSAKL